MRGNAFALVFVVVLAGCGASGGESTSQVQHFFEQSERRDPLGDESSRVGNVNGCTAFFVENDQKLPLMVTARHCVNYAITNWCSGQGRVVLPSGVEGRCSRVVAADSTHDIALFEADFDDYVHTGGSFRLATYAPAVSTRLQMIGYPADQYRRAALTVTENCWVLREDIGSPHGGRINDRSALHNCTTWGGNSGGPMYEEGTDIAIGLPFTYRPGDYYEYPSDSLQSAAYLAKMQDFTATFRTTLEQEGVVLVD